MEQFAQGLRGDIYLILEFVDVDPGTTVVILKWFYSLHAVQTTLTTPTQIGILLLRSQPTSLQSFFYLFFTCVCWQLNFLSGT